MSLSVSPVLALLLMVLTPVGTGQGTHRDQILDPLFPHVHASDGSTLLLRNALHVVEVRGEGAALGAGAGAATAALPVGISPPTTASVGQPGVDGEMRLIVRAATLPAGALADPPPDPPPTAA